MSAVSRKTNFFFLKTSIKISIFVVLLQVSTLEHDIHSRRKRFEWSFLSKKLLDMPLKQNAVIFKVRLFSNQAYKKFSRVRRCRLGLFFIQETIFTRFTNLRGAMTCDVVLWIFSIFIYSCLGKNDAFLTYIAKVF